LNLEAEKICGKPKKVECEDKTIAAEEIAPELQDKGYVYYSPIVGLRQHFDLDICMRPCKSFKGNPLNFIRKGKGGRKNAET